MADNAQEKGPNIGSENKVPEKSNWDKFVDWVSPPPIEVAGVSGIGVPPEDKKVASDVKVFNDVVVPEKAAEKGEDKAKDGSKGAPEVGEKVDKVKVETAEQLKVLSGEVTGEKTESFKKAIDLSGFLMGGFKWDDVVDFKKIADEIVKFNKGKNKNLSVIGEFVEFEDKQQDASEFLANIYAAGFVSKINEEKGKMLSFYEGEWGKKPLSYSIVMDGPTTFKIKFDKAFEAAYVASGKKAEADIKVAEDNKVKVEELKKNSLAKILAFLFGWNKVGEDGKNGYQRVVDGEDPVAMFLLGLFGYKKFAGTVYDSVKSAAKGTKFEKPLDTAEKTVAKNALYNKEQANATGEVPGSEEKYQEVDLAGFQKIVDGGTIPAGGIRLKDEYVLGEDGRPEKLEVKFGEKGKMIVYEGANFKVNGSSVGVSKDEKEKPYSTSDSKVANGKILVELNIPDGTVFTEGVTFEKPKA
jgi:hypothetical protein